MNDMYAKRYDGKLLLRFDDTNPRKEKDEFEDAIIADLKTMVSISFSFLSSLYCFPQFSSSLRSLFVHLADVVGCDSVQDLAHLRSLRSHSLQMY